MKKVSIGIIIILIFTPIQLLNMSDSIIALYILIYLIKVYYIKFKYKGKEMSQIFKQKFNIENQLKYIRFGKIKTLLYLGASLIIILHLPRIFTANILNILGGN